MLRELQVARAAAAVAAQYVMDEYAAFVRIPNAPADISTHADRAAQELILRHLRNHFPDDSLIAEEATPTLADAPVGRERVWVVDPIDGTRGFATKNGEFAVMLGLIVAGRPVVGVVIEPVRKRETYAAEGSGCWVATDGGEPVQCCVSTCGALAESTLVTSHSKPGKVDQRVVAIAPARVVETYSAGIKLALVARGEVELYVNSYAGFHDWDLCAGHALVAEAGGRVTLLDGRDVIYGGQTARPGFLASNGLLHADVLARLR